MARRGDGIYLRGKTWWLDFVHRGERHVLRIGSNINRTVAKEIASVALVGLVVVSPTALAAPADHNLRVYADPRGGQDACRTGKIVSEHTGWVIHGRFVPGTSSVEHFSEGPDTPRIAEGPGPHWRGIGKVPIRRRPWTRPSLGALLDNGVSLCVDLSKGDSSSKVFYPVTVALEGMRVRLREQGVQRFERTLDLYRGAVRTGETRACCRSPLQQFLDTTRKELCEDVPDDWGSVRQMTGTAVSTASGRQRAAPVTASPATPTFASAVGSLG